MADERTIRDAVSTASVNSLDHPRYEFFYPWDYAKEKEKKFIDNHNFMLALKRKAYPGFLSYLTRTLPDTTRLRRTFVAEDRYLVGFQKFLTGIPLAEQYRLFDEALALAPWNDSLRARIFAQYSYIASTRTNPLERARLMQRAKALYEAD